MAAKMNTSLSKKNTDINKVRINAIILAGGKNSRMHGEDKAFLEIEGRPIIACLIYKLRTLTNDIIIVTNSPEKYTGFQVKLVRDERPNMGPLMGIYSGLRASSAKYNFVVGCDMPFLNEALLKYMVENIADHDVLIPKTDGRLHPLCGIYSQNCIPIIEEMLQQGKLNIASIFSRTRSHFLSSQEIERFDAGMQSLVNINTREDLVMSQERKGVKLCLR